MKILVHTLLLLALGACCSAGPTAAEAAPRHAVRVEGRYYLLFRNEVLSPQDGTQLLGPEYARVLRRVEACPGVALRGTVIDDPCGLQDGDASALLPAGTTLHPVRGVPPGQGLAATHEGRFLVFGAWYPPD